jgi:hypothetical protein
MANRMTLFSANPFAFIFMGLLLLAVGGYYAWGAFDRLGLPTESAQAVLTAKQINPPHTTYRSNIVAGRNYTQSDTLPETPVLTLKIRGQGEPAGTGEPTVAIVPKELYDQLRIGDTVNIRFQRTRLSRQLEVTEVLPGP